MECAGCGARPREAFWPGDSATARRSKGVRRRRCAAGHANPLLPASANANRRHFRWRPQRRKRFLARGSAPRGQMPRGCPHRLQELSHPRQHLTAPRHQQLPQKLRLQGQRQKTPRLQMPRRRSRRSPAVALRQRIQRRLRRCDALQLQPALRRVMAQRRPQQIIALSQPSPRRSRWLWRCQRTRRRRASAEGLRSKLRSAVGSLTSALPLADLPDASIFCCNVAFQAELRGGWHELHGRRPSVCQAPFVNACAVSGPSRGACMGISKLPGQPHGSTEWLRRGTDVASWRPGLS